MEFKEETGWIYRCNFGEMTLNIDDHILSGKITLKLDYVITNDDGSKKYRYMIYEDRFEDLYYTKRIDSILDMKTFVDTFNRKIKEQLEQMYSFGGSKYYESENKIKQLEK